MIKSFDQFKLYENYESFEFPIDMDEFEKEISSYLSKLGVKYTLKKQFGGVDYYINNIHIFSLIHTHSGDNVYLLSIVSEQKNLDGTPSRLLDSRFCKNIEEFTIYMTKLFDINIGDIMKKINR